MSSTAGVSASSSDSYMLATIVLAAVTGFLLITLIITCFCCFKQQRKLLQTSYGPESGGPRRSRMKRNGKNNKMPHSSAWMSSPYDRWANGAPGPSPGTAPCPNCHSKVGCGCKFQPPTQNWTPSDERGIGALPRSSPYYVDPGPPRTHDYDRVLLNAKGSGGVYGGLPPQKFTSAAIEGSRGVHPYSTDYGQNQSSSQLAIPSSYNNMESSTAQFVLESAKQRRY